MRRLLALSLATGAAAVVLAAPAAASSAGSVVAATSRAAAAPATTVSCTRQRCDGKDPIATGCYRDAVTITSHATHDNGINNTGSDVKVNGQLSFLYSPTCHAGWGELKALQGQHDLCVQLDEDGNYTSKIIYDRCKRNVNSVQSWMKWLADGQGYWRALGFWFYDPNDPGAAFLSFTFLYFGLPCPDYLPCPTSGASHGPGPGSTT